MAVNNSKIDSLHNAMPAVFDTRNNKNWKAIIEAIGGNDQIVADLIEEIRKQFSVKTAVRPYLDRLGARHKVQRPRFIGMDDETFRRFIPVMSYQPKQVRFILDTLLDIFFFKEATTSFIQSFESENFNLIDGDTLEYIIDVDKEEKIAFKTEEFVDINNATADEVASAINRQVQHSFAIPYEDSISKRTFIRIFTNTIGSTGSVDIKGGLADIRLKFDGFNFDAGNGVTTEWTITKIGDTITYKNTAGDTPGIDKIEVGDIVISTLSGNVGSFSITEVDVGSNQFSFINLLGTAGIFTQTSSDDVKFIEDFTAKVYERDRRALTWEVNAGEITVEIPPTPPVVRRTRKGGAYLNGVISLMSDRISNSELELEDSSSFPESGQFLIEKIQEIQTELSPTEISNFQFNGRLICETKYTYTGKSGNNLTGVSPFLPTLADINKLALTSADRLSNEIIATLSVSSTAYEVGEYVVIEGVTGPSDINGSWKVLEVVSSTVLRLESIGVDGVSTVGDIKVEKIGLAQSGSKIILRSSVIKENTEGPFLWDTNAPFILSSLTTNLTLSINAGDTERNIQVDGPNDIPNEEGQLIFDFGTLRQEGPVRYFSKPSDTSIAIDPAFVFQYNHDVGSAVTMIRKRGGIQFDGLGSERAPYITDPGLAREVLKELMEKVKSVGIFLNFLVRYPEQLYSTLDVYNSGIDVDAV